jgi:hypothetical protein
MMKLEARRLDIFSQVMEAQEGGSNGRGGQIPSEVGLLLLLGDRAYDCGVPLSLLFRALDQDQDGYVSRREMLRAFTVASANPLVTKLLRLETPGVSSSSPSSTIKASSSSSSSTFPFTGIKSRDVNAAFDSLFADGHDDHNDDEDHQRQQYAARRRRHHVASPFDCASLDMLVSLLAEPEMDLGWPTVVWDAVISTGRRGRLSTTETFQKIVDAGTAALHRDSGSVSARRSAASTANGEGEYQVT